MHFILIVYRHKEKHKGIEVKKKIKTTDAKYRVRKIIKLIAPENSGFWKFSIKSSLMDGYPISLWKI